MIAEAVRGAAAVLFLASALGAPAQAQLITSRVDPTAGTAAIELWFRVPAAGYDLKSPGIARLALAAAAASQPTGGSSLSEIVNRLGGSLSLEVYPDISMIGASVPASSAGSVLRAMTSAFFNPGITPAGMKIAAQDSAVVAAQQPFDSSRTLQDALFAQLFSQGPAHYAPIPDPSAFAKLAQSDVQAFASRAFQRANAILSLAGNVDKSLAAGIAGNDAAVANAPYDSTPAGGSTDISVSARAAGLGLGWIGPRIADTRAATAMDFIADYLFDPDRGTVTRAVHAQRDLFVNGQFVTLHDPGVLLVTLSGESAATFQQTVLDAVTAMAQPLDAAAFAQARKAFLYHILTQIQTPLERADNAGWYAAEGNAQYAPGDSSGTYLNAASSLDPQFVAQTVRAYLQKPVIVHLIQSSLGTSTAT
jgi:predicted Zn-dependent peptidase